MVQISFGAVQILIGAGLILVGMRAFFHTLLSDPVIPRAFYERYA